jgi:hypothetical protein
MLPDETQEEVVAKCVEAAIDMSGELHADFDDVLKSAKPETAGIFLLEHLIKLYQSLMHLNPNQPANTDDLARYHAAFQDANKHLSFIKPSKSTLKVAVDQSSAKSLLTVMQFAKNFRFDPITKTVRFSDTAKHATFSQFLFDRASPSTVMDVVKIIKEFYLDRDEIEALALSLCQSLSVDFISNNDMAEWRRETVFVVMKVLGSLWQMRQSSGLPSVFKWCESSRNGCVALFIATVCKVFATRDTHISVLFLYCWFIVKEG